MSKIFYDCEFLETGSSIDLISIGMVCTDGREYYAVNRALTDRTWRGWRLRRRIRQHWWLMENVIPSLPKAHGDRRLITPDSWLFDYTSPLVKPHRIIGDEVRDFIRATPDVELWANYGAYDHVTLCWLWGSMAALPEGVPMFTHDLQQEAARLGLDEDDLPQQEDGHHNALADARHNKTLGEFMELRAEAATRLPGDYVIMPYPKQD